MDLVQQSLPPVLERLPVALVGLGPGGRIVYANDFARVQVFGASLRLGMTLEELVLRCGVSSSLLGDVVAREIDAEHLVVAVDGPARGGGIERRYYSLNAAGGVAGMTLIVLQDASPLIGLGTLINRMLSRAEAGADDAVRDIVRQLASEVAHLVRNPLASLTLNATMLGTEDPLEKPSDVEAREIVRDIEDAARRIADVVDRLVDVGRGDSTRGPASSLLGS